MSYPTTVAPLQLVRRSIPSTQSYLSSNVLQVCSEGIIRRPRWPAPGIALPFQSHSFHAFAPFHKQKGGKQISRTVEKATARAEAAGNDPLDFSAMEMTISQAQDRMKDELSKLRSGGRFNHELLETLRVNLNKEKDTVKLGDVAQVLPRGGRIIVVLVGENDVWLRIHPFISMFLHIC